MMRVKKENGQDMNSKMDEVCTISVHRSENVECPNDHLGMRI